jgi:hypothetical protein
MLSTSSSKPAAAAAAPTAFCRSDGFDLADPISVPLRVALFFENENLSG